MTALKPIENRRVRGVPFTKYPVNQQCSHPDCADPVPDNGHHIFPRSQIGNASYFVEIAVDGEVEATIPHVTGLCRPHHDAVEQHSAWIKWEDGEFVWYDRTGEPPASQDYRPLDAIDANWELVGPLAPQPAQSLKKTKRRKNRKAAEKGERETHTIRFPRTDESPSIAEQYFDMIPRVEALIGGDDIGPRSEAYTIVSALGYVLLNEGHPDG